MAIDREQVIIDEHGRKRRAVVLSPRRYRRLLQDLYDLALIAAVRDEPSESIDEVERKLREDGVLPS
jgi:mRNA-degrading endonuclease toxin of MazEF toxin-antitoxin module